MRAVLDSNVLISALISAGSPPDLIYRAWREKRFILVTSRMQLDELRRASRYPKLQKLVSWNFRHIVRLDKIRLFNAVNIEQGYKPISIYSPREVISYGQEE